MLQSNANIADDLQVVGSHPLNAKNRRRQIEAVEASGYDAERFIEPFLRNAVCATSPGSERGI